MHTVANNESKNAIGWSIALGVIMILLGIFAIVFPFVATLVAQVFIGWLMVFRGIVQSVLAIRKRQEKGFFFDLLVGILWTIGGFLLLFFPLPGVLALTLVLGLVLVFEGILEVFLAFQLRPMTSWGWLLFDGILTIAIGAIIWLGWPSTAPWALGLLVGIGILSTGITRLVFSLMARNALRQT